jgi:hypothetical protein
MTVLDNVPDAEYHADTTALSVSGAKMLLPPSTPALFKWQRENGRPGKRTFDVGHLIHKLVLGAGSDIVVIDAADFRSKAAQTQRDEAREAGLIPALAGDVEQAQLIARSVHAHTDLFTNGKPEQSLYWTDKESGVHLKARLDWLPDSKPGRMIVPDLKSAMSADPETWVRNAATYGYHLQAAHYMEGVIANGLAEEVDFVFVLVEKTAPYLVSVVELDSAALRIGRERMSTAIQIYKHCTETGVWPGYPAEPQLVSLPVWYSRLYEEEMI